MCIEPGSQRGITLIEQIVFMLIVSVGVVGLVSTMSSTVAHSADPQVTKQLAVIAESLLAEVAQQPMTWCDPDDASAASAGRFAACASTPQNALGPTPAGETRATFDNVADYAGQGWDDITDAAGNNALVGYRGEVAMAWAGVALGLADDNAALRITVTACRTGSPAACVGRDAVSLTGYRLRYAPHN